MEKPAERLRPFNPLAGVFESDRGFHEGQAAHAVIDHLADKEGWRVRSWELRPQCEANPDFVVVLEDGRHVGIEVTEFLDPIMPNRCVWQRSAGAQLLYLASGMLRVLRRRFAPV